MINGFWVFVFIVWLIRHGLQLVIDFRNSKLRVVSSCESTAPAVAFVGGYAVVLCMAVDEAIVNGVDGISTFGAYIIAIGSCIGMLGLWAIRGWYTERLAIGEGFNLITTGVYGIVRHPIRVGLMCEAIGLVLVNPSYLGCSVICAMAILVVMRNRDEERLLVCHSGRAALDYIDTVPSMNFVVGLTRRLRISLSECQLYRR